ncbi:MAG TPA: hypothetical protein VF441_10015 [Acidimicrobiia bacterium]
MRLDLPTVLLQWATGGLLFLWVTTRRREVGLGYGWLLRSSYGVLALIGLIAGLAAHDHGAGATLRNFGNAGVVLGAGIALAVSVVLRSAGVSGQRARRAAKAQRVAAMTQLEPSAAGAASATAPGRTGAEFPPALDLLAPALGLFGILGSASVAGGPYGQSALRLVIGALFLGVISDAMLLGHWYLVQPGLGREPLKELVRLVGWIWPFEVAALLWPIGMLQVLSGSISDGYHGLLGYTWVVCALTTIALVGVTWLALRERYYSAVMAATGLLYLAILTAFGTDLVARAVLAS